MIGDDPGDPDDGPETHDDGGVEEASPEGPVPPTLRGRAIHRSRLLVVDLAFFFGWTAPPACHSAPGPIFRREAEIQLSRVVARVGSRPSPSAPVRHVRPRIRRPLVSGSAADGNSKVGGLSGG
jgi:hypothetical protein